MRKLLASVLGLGWILACPAIANEQAKVTVASLAKEKAAELDGYLSIPEGAGPFPAVVLLHSCNGITPNVNDWAAFLRMRGFAALVLDSFTTRGIKQICTDISLRLTYADRSSDAYGALKYLQSLPNIIPSRIGIMGFSHGAMSTLKAISETTSFPLGEAFGFAAAIALYPDCLTSEVDPRVPLLIQIGEKDDWTMAEPCRQKVSARKKEGYPVEIEIYPNAYHSFDSSTVQYHVNGAWLNYNKAGFCCGASIGYNKAAHLKSEQMTLAFFTRLLKDEKSSAMAAGAARPAPSREDVVNLVKAAKEFAATNGKEKLIEAIRSQDERFRKRRQYLFIYSNAGVIQAHGQIPVAFSGFDVSRSKDLDGKPILETVRSALGRNPPWDSIRGPFAENDIYVERLDDDSMIIGALMR